MSDEQVVAKTNPVPERDQDTPLKDRLHETLVPDNRLSGEQMPLTEASVGYGNEGPERTVAGEDTHEIGSYAEGGSHTLGNRQTELLDKQGGKTMTGYPDYYRPKEEREQ